MLIATMGTSPGAVVETVANLRRGTYDCGSGGCAPVDVKRVVLVATAHPVVRYAAIAARILLLCGRSLGIPGLEDPIDVSVKNVDVQDIDSREAYEKFSRAISSEVLPGSVIDITGGRASMAVAAALAPVEAGVRGVKIVATIVPHDRYQELQAKWRTLTQNYDLDKLWSAVAEGCETLKEKYPDASKLLADLVTGKAKTILLHEY